MNLPTVLDRSMMVRLEEAIVRALSDAPDLVAVLSRGITRFNQRVILPDPEEVSRRQIWNTSEGDDICLMVFERVEQAAPNTIRERCRNYVFRRMYEGHELEQWSESDMRVEPVPLPDGFPRYTRARRNRTMPIVLETASTLQDLSGILEAPARSSSEADIAAARMATDVVTFWHDSKRMRQVKAAITLQKIIYGTAWSDVRWNPRAWSTLKNVAGDVERGLFGEIDVETGDFGRLYFPPDTQDLDHADWIVKESVRSRSWMEQHFPTQLVYMDGRDEDKTPWGEMDGRHLWPSEEDFDEHAWNDWSGYSSALPRTGSPSKSRYRIWEHWERHFDSDIGAVWWYTVICRGLTLKHEPWMPFDDFGYKVGTDGRLVAFRQPFSVARYAPIPGRMKGMGIVRMGRELIINLSLMDQVVNTQAINSMYTILTTSMDAKNTPITNRRGLAFVKWDGERPEFFSPAVHLEALIRVVEYMQEQLERSVMRPDVMRGESPSHRSGKAIQLLSNRAMQAADLIRHEDNRFYEEHYGRALTLAQQMYDETRLLGISEDDRAGALAFNKADIDGATDVRVVLSDLFAMPMDQRMEYIAQQKQLGLISEREALMAVRRGVGRFVSDDERQQRVAELVIRTIVSMDEAQAVAAASRILAEVKRAEESDEYLQAQIVGEQAAMDGVVDRAIERALTQSGLGLDSGSEYVEGDAVHPAIVHSRSVRNFLATKAGASELELSKAKRFLLEQRMAMSQRAAQAEMERQMALAAATQAP